MHQKSLKIKQTEEKIRELKDRNLEIIQVEQERKKDMKNQEIQQQLFNLFRKGYIGKMVILEEERRKGTGR